MADETQTETQETPETEVETPQTPEAPETDDLGGEEFDKDRALATIRKQREAEAAAQKRAKEAEAELKKYRDAEKTEQEKLVERAEAAEADAATTKTELLRLKAAVKYGLDEEDLDLLGNGTEEQIEARAKRLSERSAPSEEAGGSRRPRERLKSGAVPSAEPEETDPRKLAEQVPPLY